MPPRIRAHPRQTGAAFTLVELLLAMALLTLLIGAIAFNFHSLRGGQSLDEGATQFEALLRLARAHAASSGRPVHLGLVQGGTMASDPGQAAGPNEGLVLAVVTQPDPLRRPEIYQPLQATTYLIAQLADLVRLEIPLPPGFDLGSPSDPGADPAASPDPLGTTPDAGATNAPASGEMPFRPVLTFQPDGSSAAADFILHSQEPEDRRRVHIHVDAITGLLRRRWVSPEAVNPLEELPDEALEERDRPPGMTWDPNDPAFIPATNQFSP